MPVAQLRQLCCHPQLGAKQPSTTDDDDGDAVGDLAESLGGISLDAVSSSKMTAALGLLKKTHAADSSSKSVLVSGFTGFLDLVAASLHSEGVAYLRIDGSVNVSIRESIVEQFNTGPDHRVLLLSMGAGAVGLNLVGANHIFILDLPFNPAVLDQVPLLGRASGWDFIIAVGS